MNRLARITHSITAVLRHQDIPDPDGEWGSVEHVHHSLRGNVTQGFRTRDGIEYTVYFVPQDYGVWDVAFASEEDSQHPFEVIQRVAGIVRQFIVEHKPAGFRVSPTSKSRNKLYRAMFEKFLPEAELFVDHYGDLTYELPDEGRVAVLRPDDIPFSEGEFVDSGHIQGFPPGSVIRSFTTSDGIDYDVYFNPKKNYAREYSHIWEVSFGTDIYKEAEGESKHHYEVIQNLAGIIRQFIQEFDPSHFYLSPTSKSRRKLYKTMFNRLLPGSKLEEWQGAMIYALPGAEGEPVEASRVAILTPEELPESTSPEEWEDWEYPGGVRVITQTFQTSDGAEYKVFFKPRRGPGLSNAWEVVFVGDSKRKFEVMQKVAAAIRDFIQEYDPSYLVLNPTTLSRHKLYKTMMRRLLPEAVDKGWEKPLVYTLPESRQACRVAVLRPEEIPDPEGEWELSEDRYSRGMVTKNFTTSDGVEYEVYFRPRPWGSDRMWDLSFAEMYEGEQSEHPFEVIQKVVGVTRQFIAEYNPTHFWVSSTSPSRRKLYRSMFKRFLPEAKFKPGSSALIYVLPQ